MTKARLRIHDQSRADHQQTTDALKEALQHAISHEIEGAIIILTRKHNKEPVILRAGKMIKNDRALLQLARLQLHLVVEDE